MWELKIYVFNPKKICSQKLGWNLRMTNIQAALGLAQLERLDKFIIKKIGEIYNDFLKDINGLQLPVKKQGMLTIYMGIWNCNKKNMNADNLIRFLSKKGLAQEIFLPTA